MMKCYEISERLGEYWDLPDHDELKRAMDQHIASCEACREEFEIWNESASLIQSVRGASIQTLPEGKVTQDVMERIYHNESWRLPVAFRTYTFSYRVRRNIMACLAMCLAIFVVSFIYTFVAGTDDSDYYEFAGVIDIAVAKSAVSGERPAMFDHIPVASISSPSLLKASPIVSYSNSILAASIVGFVFMLLLMNWLSRLRA